MKHGSVPRLERQQNVPPRNFRITNMVMPMIVISLATVQFYHCWQVTGAKRGLEVVGSEMPVFLAKSLLRYSLRDPSHENPTAGSSHPLSALLPQPFAFTPLPKLPQHQSIGACLMVKGDNDLLSEWIPYHFTVLPLRHLLVATDNNNTEDPQQVLDRWKLANTGLNFKIVNVSSFESTMHGPLQFDLEKDLVRYNRDVQKKGQPTVNSTEDLLFQRDVAHHHLMHKQTALISYCTNYMKEAGVRWVTYHDTDEFLVINRNEPSMDLSALADHYWNATALDILQKHSTTNSSFKDQTCYVLPRVTVGATENFTCPEADDTVRFARRNFDHFSIFNTLRFHKHAKKDDFAKNRFGKAFVNIHNLSQHELDSKPNNIHRPFPRKCPRPVAQVSKSPFYLLHYVGGWERFHAKGDIRRGYSEWRKRAMIADSTSCCEQQPYRWLAQFIQQVGLERAQYLMG
jgi:hypothetical protein